MRVFVSIPSVTSVFFRANKLGNQTVETFIEGDISLNQTIDVVNKLQKVEIIILDECASGKSCIFLAKIYPSSKFVLIYVKLLIKIFLDFFIPHKSLHWHNKLFMETRMSDNIS